MHPWGSKRYTKPFIHSLLLALLLTHTHTYTQRGPLYTSEFMSPPKRDLTTVILSPPKQDITNDILKGRNDRCLQSPKTWLDERVFQKKVTIEILGPPKRDLTRSNAIVTYVWSRSRTNARCTKCMGSQKRRNLFVLAESFCLNVSMCPSSFLAT